MDISSLRRTRGNSKDEIRVALRTFASAAFAGAAAVVVAFPAFAALPFALAALAGHVYTFWSHLDGGGIRGGGGRGGERRERRRRPAPHTRAQQTQRRIKRLCP